MKQATFAEAIGLTVKAAGDIERGKKFPKPENLEPIAKALQVPLFELFKFDKGRFCPEPPEFSTTEPPRHTAKKAKKGPKAGSAV